MKMYYKNDNCMVEVYKITEDKMAIIYSPSLARRQNGNGWNKVKLGTLIPGEYYNSETYNFMSKTERNKIKSKLILSEAKWTCTDGTIFNDIEKAIEHEKSLERKERSC